MNNILYLSPLQGYTELEFRRAWSKFFIGFDLSLSPFIPLVEGARFRNQHLRDVLPDTNKELPVIPQVLGNDSEKFLMLAHRLHDLGYKSMNWNLGCPKKSVASKKRGSGLLPYPGMIQEILEKIIPEMPLKLSIKTRLGYYSANEFTALIKVYNSFPLENLIIHPRTGIQMYDGEMYLEDFEKALPEIRQEVVFSGEIVDYESYKNYCSRFPTIKNWMIGRSVLSNPFLPEWIKTGKTENDEQKIRLKLQHFHEELYCEIRHRINNEKPLLSKMKDYWSYFSHWFQNEQSIFIHLAHLDSLNEFNDQIRKFFETEPLAPFTGRSNKPLSTNLQSIIHI
jgi:tRNA-dihydrouridine synthase